MDKELNRKLKELKKTGLFTILRAAPMFEAELSGTPFVYILEYKNWVARTNKFAPVRMSITPRGSLLPKSLELEPFLVYETSDVIDYLSRNHPSVAEKIIFYLDLLS